MPIIFISGYGNVPMSAQAIEDLTAAYWPDEEGAPSSGLTTDD